MNCKVCNSNTLECAGIFSVFPSAAQAFYDDKESAKLDPAKELNLFECLICGHYQIDSEPVSYYKSVITAASLGPATRAGLAEEWKSILNRFSNQKIRALEIGAGSGDFVRLMRSWGLDAVGIEYYIDRKSAGSTDNIIDGYLPDYKTNEKFELVVCNNFLEHHPYPRQMINSVKSLLSVDATVYISVPRFEYILENSCFYELIPDHLNYFTKESLIYLFQSFGFEIIEYYTKNNGNDHVALFKAKKARSIQSKLTEFEKIVFSLRQFLRKRNSEGRSLAVWGAGHRSLTLLSMASQGEISCIVDSAKFKQGRYAPIIGYPIISPEEFYQSPTDELLLMLPGNFAEQVVASVTESRISSSIWVFKDEPNIQRVAF